MTGFRTLALALLMSGAGVVQAFDWTTIIPQGQAWSGAAMIGMGALMAFMRSITTTPVGTAPPAATK